MAYTINLTNGDIFVTIPDGQSDETAPALTLIGKNYTGYGKIIGDNFIHILENSADDTFNGVPLTGQLWYDSSDNILKVYNGASFKSVSGATSQVAEPANPVAGDLWFNSSTEQMYAHNGTDYKLVGPAVPAGAGESGPMTVIITDTVAADHTVVEYWVNDERVGIMSKDAVFTPNAAIAGFATIQTGFQLSTSVTGGTPLFVGTASDADRLGGVLASGFVSATTSDSMDGSLTILDDNGLTFGAGSFGQLKVVASDLELRNVNTNGDIIFGVNDGGVPVEVIVLDGLTGRARVDDPVNDTDIVNKQYLAAQIGTAGLSALEVKTLYESNSETNEFNDTEKSKLAALDAAAAPDQTNAEIKTAYEANWLDSAGVTDIIDFSYTTMIIPLTTSILMKDALNKGLGRKTEIVYVAGGSGPYIVTLNASWHHFGEQSPITLQNDQILVLSLTGMGSLETEVLCAAVRENI